jgi:hypothetical protein
MLLYFEQGNLSTGYGHPFPNQSAGRIFFLSESEVRQEFAWSPWLAEFDRIRPECPYGGRVVGYLNFDLSDPRNIDLLPELAQVARGPLARIWEDRPVYPILQQAPILVHYSIEHYRRLEFFRGNLPNKFKAKKKDNGEFRIFPLQHYLVAQTTYTIKTQQMAAVEMEKNPVEDGVPFEVTQWALVVPRAVQ